MDLFLHNKTVYKRITAGPFNVDAPLKELVEQEPVLEWNGGLIPMALWRQIIGYFRWTYKKHHSEALMYLFYNEQTREWRAWAPPQESAGMTVHALPDHKDFSKQRSAIGAGFDLAGTVHHHCSTSAFQSDTDHSDEEGKNGLHITVGKMDEAKLDLNARVCYAKTFYKAVLSQWFEIPNDWKRFPFADLLAAALERQLVTVEVGGFPSQWRENYREKTYTSVVHTGFHVPSSLHTGSEDQTVPGPEGNSAHIICEDDVPSSAVDYILDLMTATNVYPSEIARAWKDRTGSFGGKPKQLEIYPTVPSVSDNAPD